MNPNHDSADRGSPAPADGPGRRRRARRLRLIAVALLAVALTGAALLVRWVLAAEPGAREPSSPGYASRGPGPGGLGQRLVRRVKVVAGQQVSRFIRWRAETDLLRTHLDQAELIARFLHGRTPQATRRADAWRLAVLATPEAFAALQQALATGSPGLRAAAAEALGHSPLPEARELLLSLVGDPDPGVRLAVLRALALLGDDEAVAVIARVLLDEDQSPEVRLEAARVLGNVESAAGLTVLLEAYRQAEDEELAAVLLSSLGKHPFADTGWVFRAVVASTEAEAELKVAAVEALADSSADAIPFLLDVAEGHGDPEVRASAAWSAGVNAETGGFAAPIAELLLREPEADVRRRLYEAMTRQRDVPADVCLAGTLRETDLAARVAGANAVAVGVRQGAAPPAVASQFETVIVPQLVETALSEATLNLRMRSVFALRRAGTPSAREALAQIAASASGPVAQAAEHGLAAQ